LRSSCYFASPTSRAVLAWSFPASIVAFNSTPPSLPSCAARVSNSGVADLNTVVADALHASVVNSSFPVTIPPATLGEVDANDDAPQGTDGRPIFTVLADGEFSESTAPIITDVTVTLNDAVARELLSLGGVVEGDLPS
jgi:hypothetical protein